MDNNKLISTLKNIIFQFGASVLTNKSTLTSLIADYVPELTLERKLIKETISVNALKDLIDANFSSDDEKNNALLKAQQKLINLCGINDNLAANILNCFAEALGWNVGLLLTATLDNLDSQTEINEPKQQMQKNPDINGIENTFTRANMFLADKNWALAIQYFNNILDIDPKNSKAYLGLFMAENEICSHDKIGLTPENFDINENPSLRYAILFANDKEKTEIIEKIENAKKLYDEKYLQLKELREKYKPAKKLIEVNDSDLVVVRLDGSLEHFGSHDYNYNGIRYTDSIVLKFDFTTVLTGHGEVNCVYRPHCNNGRTASYGWINVEKIDGGSYSTIALRKDGTCIASGDNYSHDCDVYEWTDIIDIACGCEHTVGLKKDGTLICCGGQDYYRTIGKIKCNYGQCELSDLKDVVSIACGNYHTVALKQDGTVVARGWNQDGQCNTDNWTDIVEVSCGNRTTFGIKKNGTVVSCGANNSGQCETNSWSDIVAVKATNNVTIGIHSDGTIISAGISPARSELGNPKLFDSIESLNQEKEMILKNNITLSPLESSIKIRKQKGVCQHCGGWFSGNIFKKCSVCGKRKDY